MLEGFSGSNSPLAQNQIGTMLTSGPQVIEVWMQVGVEDLCWSLWFC
jgi:hypothetical protein